MGKARERFGFFSCRNGGISRGGINGGELKKVGAWGCGALFGLIGEIRGSNFIYSRSASFRCNALRFLD